ncbi:HU family DNA-binding protein [Litoreibacter janthinus]|uniref:DNA-binding protein n=1 Tax=Litoreibacter janthinus TaxID=670154 RepID=A0A1I6H171_9RHOB|nr:HU family DNA-binding protein [Litoreibacter janthinus]SFR48205.1 DNA-binding protein [Litoreibacter janthinus]
MATKPKTTGTKKTKRSTTRAASTTPKAAAKTAPKATVVSTKSVNPDVSITADAPEWTKKEMVARMVAKSGMKKGDARRALEATMDALADALREGNNLSLPPLGKIKIARTKDTPNGKMVVLRAKLKEPKPDLPNEPLAEAAE